MVDFPEFSPQAVFESKKDSFTRSTLIEILVQLGAEKKRARSTAERLGPSFDTDWFNDRALITPLVNIDRIERYSLDEVLFRPERTPLVRAWQELCLLPGRHLLVIKFVSRRLVVANKGDVPDGWPHVRYGDMCILRFNGYFTEQFGTALSEEQEI